MTAPDLSLAKSTAAQRLNETAEQASAWVLDRFYQAHPDYVKRFGARGRQTCREDIDYHLQFLTAALESDAPEILQSYLHWLSSVLENRGVPGHHLRESLALIEDFVVQHLPDAAAPIRQMLAAGIEALDTGRATLLPLYNPVPRLIPQSRIFTSALLKADRKAAQSVVSGQLQQDMHYTEIAVGIVQPALYEIGQLWQINRISVAQEHLATAICQYVLTWAFTETPIRASQNRNALFTCVEGNHHSLGLRMIADTFEIQGWDCDYLGANTPTSDLLRQVDNKHPDLLGLSMALPQHLRTARNIVDRCRAEFGPRCPVILVGGLALNAVDGLWSRTGADLWYPDAQAALREAA